jgi:hypothetical protein
MALLMMTTDSNPHHQLRWLHYHFFVVLLAKEAREMME